MFTLMPHEGVVAFAVIAFECFDRRMSIMYI
jgi:hypothetical protein